MKTRKRTYGLVIILFFLVVAFILCLSLLDLQRYIKSGGFQDYEGLPRGKYSDWKLEIAGRNMGPVKN